MRTDLVQNSAPSPESGKTIDKLANLAGTSRDTIRKGFTKSERVDYIKRLLRIEQAKAKERQGERTSDQNGTEVQRADQLTAEQFGIGRTTMRRELFIADNKDHDGATHQPTSTTN